MGKPSHGGQATSGVRGRGQSCRENRVGAEAGAGGVGGLLNGACFVVGWVEEKLVMGGGRGAQGAG